MRVQRYARTPGGALLIGATYVASTAYNAYGLKTELEEIRDADYTDAERKMRTMHAGGKFMAASVGAPLLPMQFVRNVAEDQGLVWGWKAASNNSKTVRQMTSVKRRY